MAGMFLSQRFMHEARITEGYMNKSVKSGHHVIVKCGCGPHHAMAVFIESGKSYNFDHYENYRYQEWLKEHR